MTLIRGKNKQTNKHNDGYNPRFIKPEVYNYDDGVAIKLFLDCCLRAHYDEFKHATKDASKAEKKISFVQIHFMKIHGSEKTGAAIHQ